MKLIPLSQGKFSKVDDSDYEYLSRFKWCAMRAKNSFYAGRARSKKSKIGPMTIMMHREILKSPAGLQVDHENGDGLDNQRHNLRAATRVQNSHEFRTPFEGKTSRFRGVSWQKRGSRKGRWKADIRFEGKKIFLGYSYDESEAARLYDIAAILCYAKFASLNFPSGVVDKT